MMQIGGINHINIYCDVFDLILLKKAEYVKRLSFYVAMWEETMAFTHILRGKNSYYQVQVNKEAWAFTFERRIPEEKSRILKEWKGYFLQRNLSYFFTKDQVIKKDYSFQRGLSCYADCTIHIDEDIRKNMRYIPGQICLLLAMAIDLKNENFEVLFEKTEEVLKREHLVMCGDPWGNIGYWDEKPDAEAKDYLFLWVPVEAAGETE